MPVTLDMTGQRYGRLEVLRFAGHNGQCRMWLCRCDCGTERSFRRTALVSGRAQSCGCRHKEITSEIGHRNATHGHTLAHKLSPEYMCWRGMIMRCYYPSQKYYYLYGGRSIAVCDEWRADFARFLADMGPRPSKKHTVDRIDNDLGYSKANCRWATKKEQCNNKRNNLVVEMDGMQVPIRDAAKTVGVPIWTVFYRIYKMKMTPEQALSARKGDLTASGKLIRGAVS